MNEEQTKHFNAAIEATDQAMTQVLEAHKILTELLGDIQEMNHEMIKILELENEL